MNRKHTPSTGKKAARPRTRKKTGAGNAVLSRILSVLFTILLVMLITGTIVGAAFALYLNSFVDISVDDILLLSTGQDQSTQLYYMNYTDRVNRIGTPVLVEDQNLSGGENRVWVSYDEIPKNLINAFVAIEDRTFFEHKGVSWKRTIGATFKFFLPGGASYGGSTITQQVIKNITGNDDVTIQRKVQEIFMALNLEKKLDKSEILEIYLNTIYLSQHSYGVQAAAKTYFGKDVSDLSLVECAAIARITQAPTKWDPVQNPENNVEGRRVVLTAMHDQHLISDEEYYSAYDEELVLVTDSGDTGSNSVSGNSWYTDAVISESIKLLVDELGVSEQVANNMIYTRGLKIYTLMDPAVQNSLESVFESETGFPYAAGTIQPKCSMVVIDPYTGDVVGLVGDRGVKKGDRIQNFATQTQRSPGSSIKPLSVYAPALENGVITYGSVADDVPLSYGEDGKTPWPSNSPNVYKGVTTDAIARSVNTISLRTLRKLGVETSFDFVKNKLHMDGFIESKELESGYILSDMTESSLGLGGMSYGVTVEEITAAYAMFVNGGTYYKPRIVLRICDSDDNVIVENKSESNTAISESTSQIMTKMLCEVVDSGTAARAVTLKGSVATAGKTGTTSNDIDKWFIGYTPYYVGGVWFGYEWGKSLTPFRYDAAATVWNIAMEAIHQPIFSAGGSLKTFTTSADVVQKEYCRYSGKLLTDACLKDPRGNAKEIGYFTVDTVPSTQCDTHVLVDVCADSGKLATDACPAKKKVAMVDIDREKIPEESGITVGDAEYVLDKSNTCDTHKSGSSQTQTNNSDQKTEDPDDDKQIITDNNNKDNKDKKQ